MASKDSNKKDSANRISSSEKEELLSFPQVNEGLSKFHLFIAFCIMFVVLVVLIPKIYLSNNIYRVSRDISRLSNEKMLLDEEALRLNNEIEIVNNKHLMLELGLKH